MMYSRLEATFCACLSRSRSALGSRGTSVDSCGIYTLQTSESFTTAIYIVMYMNIIVFIF